MERVHELVEALESCPSPEARKQAAELVATLMEFHATALGRMLRILEDAGHRPLIETLGHDPLTGGLLLLHDLHPEPLEARVQGALEQVRPALGAHKGDVELLRVDGASVYLRLKGTCNGCASSATTFRNMIESAILDRAPEVEQIHVEGMVA